VVAHAQVISMLFVGVPIATSMLSKRVFSRNLTRSGGVYV
jgi:hypothetical protein